MSSVPVAASSSFDSFFLSERLLCSKAHGEESGMLIMPTILGFWSGIDVPFDVVTFWLLKLKRPEM